MSWKIPLFKTYSDEDDITSVTEILKRGTYWATGKEINEFEEKLAEFNERKFALTFNSGTSALLALLQAHKLTNCVNNRITNKTKAIIPVLYGGQPCRDLPALREIAEDKKILLIEDAAESFGSTLSNTKAGNFGHSAMFSLCQNKVITTGEGGFNFTDEKEIYLMVE